MAGQGEIKSGLAADRRAMKQNSPSGSYGKFLNLLESCFCLIATKKLSVLSKEVWLFL